MNIEEKNIALFENYLSNEMDEKTMQEFEAKLIYDSDFNNQFEAFKSLEAGIKEHFASELKQKFSEIDVELDKKLSLKPRNNKIIWLSTAVAASIVLGVFIYQHFSNSISLQQLVQENWTRDEGLPVQMSSKGKYDDAMNAYKFEDWNIALDQLNKIESDTSFFYKGLIHFQKKEYQNSILELKKISNESVFFDEAQFRISLNYLSLGNKKAAMEYLNNIATTEKPEYRIQAEKILKVL